MSLVVSKVVGTVMIGCQVTYQTHIHDATTNIFVLCRNVNERTAYVSNFCGFRYVYERANQVEQTTGTYLLYILFSFMSSWWQKSMIMYQGSKVIYYYFSKFLVTILQMYIF